MQQNVTIMAKNPFTTRVKTRLAEEIGEDAARGTYARLLYQTLNTLTSEPEAGTSLTLSLFSPGDGDFFRIPFPELTISQQVGDHLGERLQHALHQAFHHGARKALVIGSDLPGMQWDVLRQAFDLLQDCRVVLGPTRDGGYYLIGMQAPGVDVFQDIPWSTAGVLKATMQKAREAGCQPILLPEKQDIDHRSDLDAWQAGLLKSRQGG